MKFKIMSLAVIFAALLLISIPLHADTDGSDIAEKKVAQQHQPKVKKVIGPHDINPAAKDPVTIATVIELSDFPSWSTRLDKKTKDFLTKKAKEIEEKGYRQITITGHTDNTGDFISNKRLSLKRADIIADYLIENGIDENKIKTYGAAYEKPKASNKTEAGRAHNRRVVIEIR